MEQGKSFVLDPGVEISLPDSTIAQVNKQSLAIPRLELLISKLFREHQFYFFGVTLSKTKERKLLT